MSTKMTMFIKKAAICCTLLFCICVMTACEEAPKRAENDALKEESHMEEDVSGKYVSVEEAKQQVHELEENTIEGISLPKHIEMPDIRTVSDVKLTPWYMEREEDVVAVIETVIENMWRDYGKIDWTSKNIKEKTYTHSDDEWYNWVSKKDKETGLFYNYGGSGFFSVDSLNDTQLTAKSRVKEYDFEWGDTAGSEDIYRLEDGEVSVSDAVTLTEKLFNENMSVLEKDQFTYKVQHLYVMKHEDGKSYDYNMVIGRGHNGLYLDTSSDFTFTRLGRSYDKTHSGNHIIAVMRHKDSLDFITLCDEPLEIETETEADKIISPVWAVQKVNREIAHVSGISFQDAGLVYLMMQDNKMAKDNVQDVFQGVRRAVTYMRPVWLFMSADYGAAFDSMTPDIHGTSVVVDALDGTLYYYEGTGAY